MKMSSTKKLVIKGPTTLNGTVDIAGAKNSALPILAASLLTQDKVILRNIPKLSDIISMLESLCFLDCKICLNDDESISIDSDQCKEKPIYEKLTEKTRASILLLGPLLAKFGEATIALPGGCKIGERPIDYHISSLEKLGAKIHIKNNIVHASAPNGLKGNTIHLAKPSVGATENIIMAASLAKGVTQVHNFAKEPEIHDLVDFLNKMGAKIKLLDDSCIEITGVNALHGCQHKIIGDRLEAGTYLIAAAATRGSVTTTNVNPNHLTCVLDKLKESGANITTTANSISLHMPNQPRAISVTTMPFPGFPTDLQAQWLAFNIIAQGNSKVIDTIYENRISHVTELEKLGAHLTLKQNEISADGNDLLQGSDVRATDIRASASLIIAGLTAKGETHIHNTSFIDRGYVSLEEKLRKIGAIINRKREYAKAS